MTDLLDSPPVYFDPHDTSLLDALWREAKAWEGTPFRPYSAVKGKGVDCVRLVGTVLADLGAIPPVDWRRYPKYTMDWGSHHDSSLLEEAIAALQLRYLRIDPGEPTRPGDVLCFSPGRSVHHLGIYLGRNCMLHSLQRSGATIAGLGWLGLSRLYRYGMRPLIQEARA